MLLLLTNVRIYKGFSAENIAIYVIVNSRFSLYSAHKSEVTGTSLFI